MKNFSIFFSRFERYKKDTGQPNLTVNEFFNVININALNGIFDQNNDSFISNRFYNFYNQL
jgi:hypothetical protein